MIARLGLLLALTAGPALAGQTCGGVETRLGGQRVHEVTESTSRCGWPFTEKTLTIACLAPGSVYATTRDGKRFALNGLAQMREKIPSAEEITRKRTDITDLVLPMSTDEWLRIGSQLCD